MRLVPGIRSMPAHGPRLLTAPGRLHRPAPEMLRDRRRPLIPPRVLSRALCLIRRLERLLRLTPGSPKPPTVTLKSGSPKWLILTLTSRL